MAEKSSDDGEPRQELDSRATVVSSFGAASTWDEELHPPGGVPPAQIDRYELRRELGRGGMGVVFAAYDPVLGRDVALKVLHTRSASRTQRLLREARAMAKLRHPNIVELYEIGEHGGNGYFTMRLVEGLTLAQRLSLGPPPAPQEAAEIALQLARALERIHAEGLAHRDVKPGNVLMEEGVRPVLADFGLVKQLEGDSTALTHDAWAVGTPNYMAPEQARGSLDEVGPRSDQYGLAAVLYELLSGAPPFSIRSQADLLESLDKPAPPLRDAPPALREVCARGLEKRPKDRYADMGEMAASLERYLRGEAPLRVSVKTRLLRLGRRMPKRARWVGAAALAGLLAVVGVWGGGEVSAWEASASREAEAEARWVQLEAQMRALRERGDGEAADALFAAFSGLEQNQGTAALAAAWMARGERLLAEGERGAAREALAQAYLDAPDERSGLTALRVLAEAFAADGDWGAVEKLRGLLEARGASPSAVLEGTLAVSRRELLSAQAALGDDLLLAALGRATPTPHVMWSVQAVDLTGDGRAELLFQRDQHGEYAALTASPEGVQGAPLELPWLAALHPNADAANLGPGGEAVFVQMRDGVCELLTLREGALVTAASWPCGSGATSLETADLDGDGVVELYVGHDRSLYRLRQDLTGAWHVDAPDPVTNASNSEVRALLAGDFDEDGAEELMIATGGWGSYDVRRLEPAGGGLRATSRVRLGELFGLVPVERSQAPPLLATLQIIDPELPHDVRVFPKGGPYAAAQGVHALALQGGSLVDVDHRAHPALSSQQRRAMRRAWGREMPAGELLAGDFNGDGADTSVLGVGGVWAWLMDGPPGQDVRAHLLRGVNPILAYDIDEDGDDELLAVLADDGGRLHVLGMGEAPLRPLRREASSPEAPPEALDPRCVEGWRRAEELVHVGLHAAARDHLLELTLLSDDPHTVATLHRRRAELFEARGVHQEAIDAWIQAAASDAALAPEVLYEALTCALNQRLDAQARTLARQLAALPAPPPELDEVLQTLSARLDGPELTFTFEDGLDPRWQRLSAVGARWSSVEDGVLLQGVGTNPVLRLPVRRDADPLVLEVTAEVRRADWGSNLSLSLVAPGQAPRSGAGFAWRGVGGGGRHARSLICPFSPDGRGMEHQEVPLFEGLNSELTLTWAYDPQDGSARCSAKRGGVIVAHDVYQVAPGALPEGPMELVFGGVNDRYASVGELILRSARTQGLTLREASAPLHEAVTLLGVGHAEAALEALPEPDHPEVMLTQALALYAVGERAGASAALKAALEAGDREALLWPLFTLDLPRSAPLLREALGQTYDAAFYDAWRLAVLLHPDAPATVDALTYTLDGLSERAASGDPDHAAVRVMLLVHRGAARRRLGRSTQALEDLALAHELGAPLLDGAGLSSQGREELGDALAHALAEQAAIYVDRQNEGAALDRLRAAQSVAPSPMVFSDRLSVRPEFEGLHDHPGWDGLMMARMLEP